MSPTPNRQEICRSLGLTGEARVFEIVKAGGREEPARLLRKKLNARTLEKLGYTRDGMRRLGYSDEALAALGFAAPEAPAPPPAPDAGGADVAIDWPDDYRPVQHDHAPSSDEIRALVAEGRLANDLRQLGVGVRQCKAAGIDARQIARMGYGLDELVQEFHGTELRTIGFRPQEMRHYFDGAQLRRFGFTAAEMRTAGFSVRNLLDFGYNPNHVITAGYGTNELVREGLSLRVVDYKKLHNS